MGGLGTYIRDEAHKKRQSEILMRSEAFHAVVQSPEYREKQRIVSVSRGATPPHNFGSKNGNWKGGIAKVQDALQTSFKYRQWRSDIFTRDNFTCQDCGCDKSGSLQAHHIKSKKKIFKEYAIKTLEDAFVCDELWNLNNGVTLCVPCHKKRHANKAQRRV